MDRDVPVPEPGPGEALVRMRASALNHIDIWIRLGKPSRPKPHTLGADGAGIVEALGPGTEGPAPGHGRRHQPGHLLRRLRGLPARSAVALRALRGARRAPAGHARRLLRRARAQPAPEARAAELRRGRGLPARVRHGLAHADDAGAPAAGRVDARLGRGLGRRQRRRHARLLARRARDRDGLARRRAGRRARARRARDDQPPQRRRARGRARADRRPRRRRRLRARRRRHLGDLDRGAAPRRAARDHGRDDGRQSARAAAPHLLEAARRARLDDGERLGVPRGHAPLRPGAHPAAGRLGAAARGRAGAQRRLEAGEQNGKLVLEIADA